MEKSALNISKNWLKRFIKALLGSVAVAVAVAFALIMSRIPVQLSPRAVNLFSRTSKQSVDDQETARRPEIHVGHSKIYLLSEALWISTVIAGNFNEKPNQPLERKWSREHQEAFEML